jgi:hypothetical protein
VQTDCKDQPIIPYPGTKVSPTVLQAEVARVPTGSVLFDPPTIQENDARSRQFACRLVIRNNMSTPVDVLAINCRLGFGVTMERRESISSPDLKNEYDQLRAEVITLYMDVYIVYSDEFRQQFVERFLFGVKKEFSFVNFFTAGGLRFVANHVTATIQKMDFPIASSADALRVLKNLKERNVNFAIGTLISSKIDRMKAIERIDSNFFLRPEYVTRIQPKEYYECVTSLKVGVSGFLSFFIRLHSTPGLPGTTAAKMSKQLPVSPCPLM